MKRILVTGASGMLGNAVVETLVENKFEVFGTSQTPNNMLSSENQFLGNLCDDEFLDKICKNFEPDVIIHTAAFVNLNFCEENKELADKLHIRVSEKLASTYSNATFIYISTDSVFDGIKGNYNETETPSPLNNYAKTKYGGELVVLKESKNPIILRTNIYGSKTPQGNSLAEWAIKKLSTGNPISGFSDVFFNPLYIKQAACVILNFVNINNRQLGIFHLGCKEKISKYSFIKSLSRYFNLNGNLIDEVKLSDTINKINRPYNTTLDTTKFEKFSEKYFSLDDGIIEMRANLKINKY